MHLLHFSNGFCLLSIQGDNKLLFVLLSFVSVVPF